MAVETATPPLTTIESTSKPTPRWRNRESLTAWLFILPSLIGFLVFTAGPVIAAGVISLLDWNLFSPARWAGLRNFARLGPDPAFRSLLLLPYATITVAVAFVWIWLYIPHDGLVNAVLGVFGINGPAWLI